MRWQKGRRSQNLDDRRGKRVGRKTAGGGIGVIILVLVGILFGVDPKTMLQIGGQLGGISQPSSQPAYQGTTEQAELVDFVRVVLADTEDTWDKIFAQAKKQYKRPKLVLFSGSTQSACGFAQAAMGPFYCPGDQQVYIDLSFYEELKTKFGAPGDFAQAYVIAHEVGHHVQTLLGITTQVRQAQARSTEVQGNAIQVNMELQADCFSGVWANHANRDRNLLEEGDIEEGMVAAAAIGDDTIQKRTRGYVVPESFTHGTAEQRQHWFLVGLKTGSVSQCDTFS